ECDWCKVDLSRLLNTGLFNFEAVSRSAAWVEGVERAATEDEELAAHPYLHEEEEDEHEHEEHEHEHEHHHHHHHHGESEVEEYGISSFVYYRRPAFDLNKFDHFIAKKWPASVIRAKGICYFSNNSRMSMMFEQAGVQKKLTECGLWYATAPEEELIELMREEPGLMRDWDLVYGDRMQKIVFIGKGMDRAQIERDLDACLEEV
ncbi:MAG: GTP-binding protein, partial [Candidatus Egerieousia sp.]|nr:GTP-binding protein [bacterium]MDY5255392.1 GTP-binding protein [Candidatus Egerieousia sp.]